MGIKFIPYKNLFIHSYNLAKNSSANKEEPFYIVFIIVLACAMFNVNTLLMFIASIDKFTFMGRGSYKLVYTFFCLLLIFLFYNKNKNNLYEKYCRFGII